MKPRRKTREAKHRADLDTARDEARAEGFNQGIEWCARFCESSTGRERDTSVDRMLMAFAKAFRSRRKQVARPVYGYTITTASSDEAPS